MKSHFNQGTLTGRESVRNWNRAEIPQAVKERAATKVVRSSDGCWISTYATGSHGYAQVGWSIGRVNGKDKIKMVLAHRASWELTRGVVPVGMTLDHLCKEKRCVNPEHLRLMDNFENARRTHGRDWAVGECANGHPNSMLEPGSRRKTKSGEARTEMRCAECHIIYRNRAKWRNANAGAPYPEGLLLASER